MTRTVLRQRRARNDEGFTLIELMVVVTIISVLAAVAIPKYITYVRSSQAAEVGSMAGTIVNAVRGYADSQGLTPTATKAAFPSAYVYVNGDTAPTGSGTDLTQTIPQLALPANSKFNYMLSSAVATDNNQDVQFCVTAVGRTSAGITNNGVVLYSSMPALSTNTNWEGSMYRKSFTSNGSTTPTAGGYCGALGSGAAAGSPYPATATQQ